MDPASIGKLGPIANALGFAGLALLVILGLAYAIRTLWKALLDEQDKGAKRDALILDQETEHQRLLVRFEESMERLREEKAKNSLAEERIRQLEEKLHHAQDEEEESEAHRPHPRVRRRT